MKRLRMRREVTEPRWGRSVVTGLPASSPRPRVGGNGAVLMAVVYEPVEGEREGSVRVAMLGALGPPRPTGRVSYHVTTRQAEIPALPASGAHVSRMKRLKLTK